MSSNLSSTAIHALNEDVLLHIFEFNGNMFVIRGALGTTLATSQVCRQWRYLMLETPSLWAKLIDIGEFSGLRKFKLQKEVLQRSGDAPLWIKADDTEDKDDWSDDGIPSDDYIRRFFKDVVPNIWHRIEKLVLPRYYEYQVTHLMLSFPAPLLVHIEAAAGYTPDRQINATTTPLFANHAPMLRKMYLSSKFVSPRAPWISQLCSLSLDDTYSFSDALSILSATVNLQELNFFGIRPRSKNTSLPIVSLPRLGLLTHCFDDPNARLTILDYMSIPIGCSLTLYFEMESPRYERYVYKKPFILCIFDHFFRHAEPTLKSQTFDCLQFEYTENKYIYWKCTANSALEPLLYISVPLHGHSDTSILELFLTKLLQLNLSSPTYLKITIDCQRVSLLESFFGHLPSIETISANLQTLSNLTDIQTSVNNNATDTSSSIFPMLKVIKLYDYSWTPEISVITEIASAFLVSRFQGGIPITTLDLSQIERLNTRPNFQALKEAKGLTVLYKL